MLIEFEKWHGLGNDFVLVNEQFGVDWAPVARELCERRTGIGADGLLVLDQSRQSMRIFNADGSVASMCGNGLRCAASYFRDRGSELEGSVWVRVSGVWYETIVSTVDGATFHVGARFPRVRMGAAAAGVSGEDVPTLEAAFGTGYLAGAPNPHWVFLSHPGDDYLRVNGAALEHDPRFADRTNVEFVTRRGPGHHSVVVWERGVGLTLACGTGAAAVASVLVAAGHEPLGLEQRIDLPGGALLVRVEDAGVHVSGPAVRVYTGQCDVRDA